LGFEYVDLPKYARESVWALRGGIFYEPRPAWTDTMPIYGFSLGLGCTVKKRFSLDFAYQFRWGKGEDFTLGDTRFNYGVEEHFIVSSLIMYF
jgi:long-subunit fatty acid transport protein